MRAAVYRGRHDLRIEEVSEPAAGPGELLLEVHAVGVCGTDAAEWERGPAIYAVPGPHPITGHIGPLIPGHEISGRVIGLGEGVEGFEQGAVVACGAGYVLEEDSRSRAGRPNLGRTYATVGLHRHGGLAQYVAVPAEICVDVRPYGLTSDAAALAQPMAIAVHAMRQGRLLAGEHALVIGAGGIGAFLIYAATELGARVAVADLSPERLRIAELLGAETLIEPHAAADLSSALEGLGIEPQVVFEVTGTEPGLASAMGAAPGGARLVLIGLHEHPREIDVRRVTLREIELIGTNAHVCGVDLPEAVRLLATRMEGWADLAPDAYPLQELVTEGIAPLAESRARRIKTLIDPWADARRPADTAPR